MKSVFGKIDIQSKSWDLLSRRIYLNLADDSNSVFLHHATLISRIALGREVDSLRLEADEMILYYEERILVELTQYMTISLCAAGFILLMLLI